MYNIWDMYIENNILIYFKRSDKIKIKMNNNCCENCCSGYNNQNSCCKTIITIFLIVATLSVASWGWYLLKKSSVPVPGSPTLSVSAEGKVVVKPDIAQVNFSVLSQGQDYNSIQEDNNQKMTKAIEYLKEIDIEEEDIKTTMYNLTPLYNYTWCRIGIDDFRSCSPRIDGYNLEQQVEVKMRELSKVGEVISTLPEKGINKIVSLNFTLDNPDEAREQARDLAIIKAKEKAKKISKTSGIKLGKIINFYESYQPRFFEAAAKGLGGEIADVVPAPIESGSQEVIVNISLSYEIR
jgi:uncharacterized protein YggE